MRILRRRAEQPQRHDEMPDVETVDVPERVVALADDLDIPELNFDDDQPAAPAYDDLDAEFASLLTEMNATEPAAAPARSAAYDDESYDAGFKSGYDRDGGEGRAPAARPAECPSTHWPVPMPMPQAARMTCLAASRFRRRTI